MFKGDETVGSVFRQAFRRVDGVTMYFFIAVWIGLGIRAAISTGEIFPLILLSMMGLMSAMLFIGFGLQRSSGLSSALVIAGINVAALFKLY